MTSSAGVLKLALSHIGEDTGLVDLDNPTSVAEEAGTEFYPIARDLALTAHAWDFATRTSALTVFGDTPDGWSFAYALPSNHLHTFDLWAAGSRQHGSESRAETPPHQIESLDDGQMIVHTDVENAVMRYALRIEDTARFSATFIEAMSWLLASMVAGPIIKGDTGAKVARDCYAVYMARIADAAARNANSSQTRLDHRPDWISNR
jgi:hypothetical protein